MVIFRVVIGEVNEQISQCVQFLKATSIYFYVSTSGSILLK